MPRSSITTAAKRAGATHLKNSVTADDFNQMIKAIISALKTSFGPGFTTKDEIAWEKLLGIVRNDFIAGIDLAKKMEHDAANETNDNRVQKSRTEIENRNRTEIESRNRTEIEH